MSVKPRAPILDQPVVLKVEDEPLVRLTQVDIRREAGFGVSEAEAADEALELLRRRQDVSVVLTEVAMPGSIVSFEFARLVAQGQPEVGVLGISGKGFPDEGDRPPSALFVAKPIRPAVLVKRLHALMACTRARGTTAPCRTVPPGPTRQYNGPVGLNSPGMTARTDKNRSPSGLPLRQR